MTSICDQCQYGQEAGDGAPVLKPTRWMSNSRHLLDELSARCKGPRGTCTRKPGRPHKLCSAEVAKAAAIYPLGLCKAILRGCRRQLIQDGRLVVGIVGIQHPETAMSDSQLERACARVLSLEVEQSLLLAGEDEVFKDAITGQPLRPELVRAARRQELEYFVAKGVWRKCPRSEAFSRQGKAPISVKWVDVNKGDDDDPQYRSRLVAREIRRPWEDTIFAPTPPLESFRSILSLAATDLKGEVRHDRSPSSEERTQISIIDITRAYFNAVTDDANPTYVDLPAEDPDRALGMCEHLQVHMYGTRRAAEGWHSWYSDHLEELGFLKGDASACVFRHVERRLSTAVHGDDFFTEGPKASLDWFKQEMDKRYELKEAYRLGPGPLDDKEGRILNRIVRWTEAGLEYEGDPRQPEKLISDLKLEGSNPLGTPGVKITHDQLAADKALDEDKHKPFRAVAARANYLAMDRPECQYYAKEVCRWMAAPTESSVAALKRFGRYLEGRRRLVFLYPWQDADCLDIYSDTDWAGCRRTRKSASGGCLMVGKHLIKSWGSTQNLVSLSSGEAGFYGVVKASGIGLGFRSLLRDLDVSIPLRVWTDSTATLGICGRQGLGKLRHIGTQCLWIQHRVRDGTFELRKVLGTENPGDLFTKYFTSVPTIEGLLRRFGCEYRGGRAETAPCLRRGPGMQPGERLLNLEEHQRDGARESHHRVCQDGYSFRTLLYSTLLRSTLYNTIQCSRCIVFYCIVLYCLGLRQQHCIVLHGIVLYCIVLHCFVLYCIVLCCIVLDCIVYYCIVLYCIVLGQCIELQYNSADATKTIQYNTIQMYCIVLYWAASAALYCIVLYCIVLCCVVLYCIVLYCIVLYCSVV